MILTVPPSDCAFSLSVPSHVLSFVCKSQPWNLKHLWVMQTASLDISNNHSSYYYQMLKPQMITGTDFKGKIIWAGKIDMFILGYQLSVLGLYPGFFTSGWDDLDQFLNFTDPLCLHCQNAADAFLIGFWWQTCGIICCIFCPLLLTNYPPKFSNLKHLLSHSISES